MAPTAPTEALGTAQPGYYVIIIASTAMIWTLLVFMIRLWIRFKLNGPWGNDDWACTLATVCWSEDTYVKVPTWLTNPGSRRHALLYRALRSPPWTRKSRGAFDRVANQYRFPRYLDRRRVIHRRNRRLEVIDDAAHQASHENQGASPRCLWYNGIGGSVGRDQCLHPQLRMQVAAALEHICPKQMHQFGTRMRLVASLIAYAYFG